MAKFSEEEQRKRIDQAKQLYCKGFEFDVIAEILHVSITTIARWAKEDDFEKTKRSQIIALSAIRDSILESFSDVLEGKKPKIKPDEASKYAIAFERFSAKKQVLSYMYEAYEMLADEYMRDIAKELTKKGKEEALDDLRKLRAKMDRVVTKLTKEVLGDE